MLDFTFSSNASLRHRHHRHLLGDQRERPMLQLARRIRLGVDVGDFLELQRAFQRDRIVQPTAEEQRVLLFPEAFRPGDDLRFEGQRRGERLGQVAQAHEVLRLRA
jgi:hypothetical protein